MSRRKEYLKDFYDEANEDTRLIRSRHGQLEYATTMHFIHKYINKSAKIIEIGAGTGKYSIALAKEGYDVSAIELVENNLKVLQKNSNGIINLKSYLGDAVDLSKFQDDYFDLTLSFGPFYHLYDCEDINKAIDEAIRVTKSGGILMFAFISIYGIMDSNYMYGKWSAGLKENYDDKMNVLHFEEQLFTGYDVCEFENLFKNKLVEYITTVGTDGSLESLEERTDFRFTDEEFKSYIKWHIHFSEKRELLGRNNHLIYICKKK